MSFKHICILTPGYPSENDPTYTFVGQLVHSMAKLGIKCSVVCPQSWTSILMNSKKKRPLKWIDRSNGNEIHVYQPLYFSTSNVKIGNQNLSYYFWKRAAKKVYSKLENIEVLYGHFWHCGLIAAELAEKDNKPTFVASGESEIIVRHLFSNKYIEDKKKNINGIICVSSKNKEESLKLNLTDNDSIIVLPNGYDKDKFHQINRVKARIELGYNVDDFIVAYTGAFIERKGASRLSKALKKIDNVKAIYIGKGETPPTGKEILYCGPLPNNEIKTYLNAANVFVLPTLAEGCSNAIVEALACGLPVISSDERFNDDILDYSNSIRINSSKIDEIANSILYLKQNKALMEKMSESSLQKAKDLEISKRARKIVNYINLNM